MTQSIFSKARQLAKNALRPPVRMPGPYGSWAEARALSNGYAEPAILQRMIAAAEKVAESDGQVQERDGVLFDRSITPYPIVAHLLAAALRNRGRLSVVDFGGALGSTYWQCRELLKSCASVQWIVVERAEVVKAGRSRFATEELQFCGSIAEAKELAPPNVALVSGVLQYLDEPYDVLKELVSLRPDFILSDRHPYANAESDVFGIQVVSPNIYAARIPFRAFKQDALLHALERCYQRVAEFPTVDPAMAIGRYRVTFRGEVFRNLENG